MGLFKRILGQTKKKDDSFESEVLAHKGFVSVFKYCGNSYQRRKKRRAHEREQRNPK